MSGFFNDLFNMGDSQQAYQTANNADPNIPEHKAKLSHEVISGAAGFAAMRAYEDHCKNSGEDVSHPMMKEMLAGLAAGEVDRLCETKGLDFIDREEAKRRAAQQAQSLADQQYGQGGTFQNPQQQQQQGGW